MATKSILVSNSLHKRLVAVCKESKDVMSGILLGHHRSDGALHLIGACASQDPRLSNLQLEMNRVSTYVPSGIDPCGVFIRTGCAHMPKIQCQLLEKVLHESVQNVFSSLPILVYAVDVEAEDPAPHLYWYNMPDKKIEKIDLETTNIDIAHTCATVRLQTKLPLTFRFTPTEKLLEKRISEKIDSLLEEVAAPTATFQVLNTGVLIQQNEGDVLCLGIEPESPIRDLLLLISRNEEGEEELHDKRKSDIGQQIIHMRHLSQITGSNAEERSIGGAPIIHHVHEEFELVSQELAVDVMVLVDDDMPVSVLPEVLVEAITRQLLQMQYVIASYVQGTTFCRPVPLHLKPRLLGHFLSMSWPYSAAQEDQDSLRKALHKLFLLPDNEPVFRPTLAYTFPDEKAADGYLTNTHVGLPPSGVKEGKVYVVQGTYTYHHYMQDRMDDNGWGCAYRSLQTIVSWFRHQGYTEKPIPTHKQIQQILVEIGDKDANFAGSRKWIGSTEVSYVLDTYLGVTSKIMFVSNGAELASKGRELAMHFEKQGTPVMIGGGVLAHTILGVDFNFVTGDLKFLILDPHYTGAEDLKVIQDKGWCGWKGPDFWDQNAYYNCCLPQRPQQI